MVKGSFPIILALFFVFAGQSIFAQKKMDKIDKEIESARNKTGEVVICSPSGKVPGTLTIDEASKRLRPGMVLRLLPGNYNPLDMVIFEQDRLIVESDNSGGYVNMPLYLYGKDCIVRSLNIRGVEADSGIIIDTKAHGITITSGEKRGSAIIANCATNGMMLYDNGQDITVRNTSIVNGAEVCEEVKVVQTRTYSTHSTGYVYNIINFGKMERKGKVSFEKCMLFSDGHLFNGDHASMKLINLTLDDNLIWCKRSLFSVPLKAIDLKTIDKLKSFFNLDKGSRNVFERPKLKLEPGGWSDGRPGIFIVTTGNGSNKEYGCNMSESKSIPVPFEMNKSK